MVDSNCDGVCFLVRRVALLMSGAYVFCSEL